VARMPCSDRLSSYYLGGLRTPRLHTVIQRRHAELQSKLQQPSQVEKAGPSASYRIHGTHVAHLGTLLSRSMFLHTVIHRHQSSTPKGPVTLLGRLNTEREIFFPFVLATSVSNNTFRLPGSTSVQRSLIRLVECGVESSSMVKVEVEVGVHPRLAPCLAGCGEDESLQFGVSEKLYCEYV
jgi:hypothetical protein